MAKKKIEGLSDLIEHLALVADGVVLTTEGIYVAGFEFLGSDMDAAHFANLHAVADRISRRMTFGSGWTIHSNLIRSEHLEYCDPSEWPDLVSELIDIERRRQFTEPGFGHLASRYFVAIAYDPKGNLKKRAADWMFTGDEDDESADRHLALFQSRLQQMEETLRANLLHVRRLKSFEATVGDEPAKFCEFMQFIRECVSGRNFRFRVPARPVHLNRLLAPGDFLGGSQPKFGDLGAIIPGKRIAVLAIDAFPECSWAGVLRVLDSVNAEFRFSMSGELIDGPDAGKEHELNRKAWGARSKPTMSQVTGAPVDASRIDADALKFQMDAADAKSAAIHGREVNMRFSAKVILADSDTARMAETAQSIRLAIEQCGFQVRVEDANAPEAWLSSLPGMHKLDIRKTKVTAENFCHMMPLSAPFRGHKYHPSKYFPRNSPPLLYAVTNGATPYRFSPYVGDVGHHLIVGPTRAGKTVLFGLEIVSFLRYALSQVVVFDKKCSLYTLIRALDGTWYDLSPDSEGEKLCPLQNLETASQRNSAGQNIELLVSQAGLEITSSVTNSIKATIDRIANERGGRSLLDFQMAVDDEAISQALEPYIGGLLDGSSDNLSFSRLTGFEVDKLYALDKKTVNGALFTIFARLKDRLDTRIPTLICVDEFTQSLSHPFAVKAFGQLLLEAGKKNAAVGFAVQEVATLLASPLAAVVLGQCLTQILLPAPQAMADGADMYRALGRTDIDREIIASLQARRDYYHVTEEHKRVMDLQLGGVARAFIAESSDQDKVRVDTLMARYPRTWQAHWLREHGLPDWAGVLEAEMTKGQEMYVCAGD